MLAFSADRQLGRFSHAAAALGLTIVYCSITSQPLCGQEPGPIGDKTSTGNVDVVEVRSELSRLIEALGADSYATRVQARDKLQRMGLEAFEELTKAEHDLDYEIALAARSLVGSYSIVWFKSDDPPAVRDALEEYGAQPMSERQSRILMLAELPDRIGLPALVRITRFERSMPLSRKAAVEIMEQALDKDPAKRKVNSEVIRLGLASGKRQSAEWLRVYAGDLADGKYSVDAWRDLIRTQRDEVDALSTEEVTRESVLNLVRICAVRAALMDNREEALRLALENADLVQATTTDLIAASNWATDNGLHPFIVGLYSKNRSMFDRSPILLYGYANALKVGGNDTEAERISDLAYRQNSIPNAKDEIDAMQPKELEEKAKLHREIAQKLRDRGLFLWAEREYKNIVDSMPIDDYSAVVAREDLSRMYGELKRHQDLIDVLSPVVDRVSKDDAFRLKMDSNPDVGIYVSSWKPRVDYHTALLELERPAADATEAEANREKARRRMMAAFKANPRDIDVLIKMCRIEGGEEWRSDVKKVLASAMRVAENAVANAERQLKAVPTERFRIHLADTLNNYAWLICNTGGDLELALKSILRSLEIVEDSAKLDTCGRCYFALGDFENAIRVQKRALAIEPYSPPLKRQLAEFEAANAKAIADAAKK